MVERVVGDVLADALLAAAAYADRGREPGEVLVRLEFLALERVLLDLYREVGEFRESAQRRTFTFAWPVR